MEVHVMNKQWWHDKVAYQIYPKSFYDSNADGIGDIPGIIEKLDYLKDLGVDIIWLSPVYRSPLADQGYDISDYYNIDPRFGTMEDMDRLLAEAGKRDLHIVMDLVVNHCSDEHEWFKKACADPEGKYGQYFYLRKLRKAAELKTGTNSEAAGEVRESEKDGAAGESFGTAAAAAGEPKTIATIGLVLSIVGTVFGGITFLFCGLCSACVACAYCKGVEGLSSLANQLKSLQ
jgi:hypothetical protein